MNNKFVVYTAVIGNYDEINQPQVVDDRFDYVLFSNDIKEQQVGVWQIKPVPYQNPIQTKVARWVKTHPEELLPEYEASLWIDSNIVIREARVYDRFVELFKDKVMISTMKHFQRKCAYEEMFEILCCGFEREKVVLQWGRLLRKEGYPKNNGLCETGVFFRTHNERVAEFNRLWWGCIEKYSRRDQFSVNYVLWKLGLPWQYFLPDGSSVYDSNCFMYSEHKDVGRVPQRIKWNKTEAWLIRYYEKCHEKRQLVENIYFKIYGSFFPMMWAFLWGQYYRVRFLLLKK